MQIISNVGVAKSNSVLAIECMENSEFDEALKLLDEAEQSMIIAEKSHMDVIAQEAKGIQHDYRVLFMHAEDQMLSTQVLMIVAKKFYNLYKKINID